MPETYTVEPVGIVRSQLTDAEQAPNQGDEGAPDVWLEFEPRFARALEGMEAGDRMIVLTWLHEASRDQLVTHPRGDRSRPEVGVFATRSPHRPNPIGMHETEVVQVDGVRLRVRGVEAIDGTPVIDLKPVLGSITER